jgi:UDP-N-acetylmuramoyl-tripeptide--D-alanyl-D-alanine ligase
MRVDRDLFLNGMKNIFKKIIIFILRLEAKAVIWKYQPKIIAITGSVGKTSTKDAIYAVLAGTAYVRKSEKSFNSEIGLPLTILGCANGWDNPYLWFKNIVKGFLLFVKKNKYPEWLILEVGIGKPGDMKKTATWLKTDIVLITAIGSTPVHIEFFNSRKHLIEEKSQLIKTLKKDGILILNKDDEAVFEMKNKTKNHLISYGFQEGADIYGNSENIFYDENQIPQGIIYRVENGGSSLPVIINGVLGRNHIYASLGALAVSFALKLNMVTAIEKLKNYEIPPGRMHLLKGIKNTLIIDDTYNSSPFACEAGLKTLGEMKYSGRKIAILGDMLELGKHTKEAHENIGKICKENCDILFSVGPRSISIHDSALENGFIKENLFKFNNSIETGEFLINFLQKNDLIFIKGSQGMRMEKIVSAILLEKDQKEKLLVRQDKEWHKR